MVKNVLGGSKSKRQGRKYADEEMSSSSVSVRRASNEREKYGLVERMYGNGRCQVKTEEGENKQCVIRNKFRGRSKSSNKVSIGTLVLVGYREWEESVGYKTCDVLEVYDDRECNVLQTSNEKGYMKLLKITAPKRDEDIFDIEEETSSTPSSQSSSYPSSDPSSDPSSHTHLPSIPEHQHQDTPFHEEINIDEI